MTSVHALKLSHFSDKALSTIEPCDPQGRRGDKPNGLWVSVDGEDDWPSWCRAENFGIERLAIRHRVTLAGDANVLLLSSAADLDAFSREYSAPSMPKYAHHIDTIDWRRIGEKYHGIIIAPYVWSSRLDDRTTWYYNWDCASGCIWRPHAIASVKEVTGLREAA